MRVPCAKPMNGTPSNACAATSLARPSRTNASRSMTAGRSCIDSGTPSGTAPPMSCSTPSTSSPASPPSCHAPAPISPDTTACSPRTASTATASSPTPPHPSTREPQGVSPRAHALDAADRARVPHRHGTLWRVWRHVARHRVHRDFRTHRENPHPSRRPQHRGHRPPPRPAAPCAASPTSGLPISGPVLTAPHGRTTAPLRLVPRALRSPAPSRHAFLFAGREIAPSRPRFVGSRTDFESDNDRTDTPATIAIDALFFLSFSVGSRPRPCTLAPPPSGSRSKTCRRAREAPSGPTPRRYLGPSAPQARWSMGAVPSFPKAVECGSLHRISIKDSPSLKAASMAGRCRASLA